MTGLIDHSGRIWSSNDPKLARVLCSTRSGEALAKYAVMNLGFVSVTRGDRFIRVACRPAILASPTIVALLQEVNDDQPLTIGFDYFTRSWNHIIVGNRVKFRNLLFSLTNAEMGDGHQPDLLRRQIDGQRSPHRGKLQATRRIFANAPKLRDVATPLDKLYGGRWSLHELDSETGHSVVRCIGKSYTPLNPAWLATAVGNSLCSYASEEYGHWVAAHHHAALRSNQPVFDEVDAILDFPTVGSARLCYSRLTLPVSVDRSERLVLSAAVSDSGINLRGLPVNELC